MPGFIGYYCYYYYLNQTSDSGVVKSIGYTLNPDAPDASETTLEEQHCMHEKINIHKNKSGYYNIKYII